MRHAHDGKGGMWHENLYSHQDGAAELITNVQAIFTLPGDPSFLAQGGDLDFYSYAARTALSEWLKKAQINCLPSGPPIYSYAGVVAPSPLLRIVATTLGQGCDVLQRSCQPSLTWGPCSEIIFEGKAAPTSWCCAHSVQHRPCPHGDIRPVAILRTVSSSLGYCPMAYRRCMQY